jgi:hypothetical protein
MAIIKQPLQPRIFKSNDRAWICKIRAYPAWFDFSRRAAGQGDSPGQAMVRRGMNGMRLRRSDMVERNMKKM